MADGRHKGSASEYLTLGDGQFLLQTKSSDKLLGSHQVFVLHNPPGRLQSGSSSNSAMEGCCYKLHHQLQDVCKPVQLRNWCVLFNCSYDSNRQLINMLKTGIGLSKMKDAI